MWNAGGPHGPPSVHFSLDRWLPRHRLCHRWARTDPKMLTRLILMSGCTCAVHPGCPSTSPCMARAVTNDLSSRGGPEWWRPSPPSKNVTQFWPLTSRAPGPSRVAALALNREREAAAPSGTRAGSALPGLLAAVLQPRGTGAEGKQHAEATALVCRGFWSLRRAQIGFGFCSLKLRATYREHM